jgi:uncharacterized protein involved in exopolysaccharide biosynthesis
MEARHRAEGTARVEFVALGGGTSASVSTREFLATEAQLLMSRAVCEVASRALASTSMPLSEQTIDDLREALKVQQIDESLVMEVNLDGAEPRQVELTLKAVLDSYLRAAEQRREDVNALLNRSSQAFEQNLEAIGRAETGLASTLRTQAGVEAQVHAPQEIAEIQRMLLHAELEAGRQRAELSMLEEALRQKEPAALVPLASVRMAQLRADKLVAARLLAAQLAVEHPKLKAAEAELDTIALRIREEVHERAEELSRRIQRSERSQQELENLLSRVQERTQQRELERLEQERYRREIALRTQVHDLQLATLAKAKLAEAPSFVPRVFEPARVRERRVLPAALRVVTALGVAISSLLLVLRLRASAHR